MEGPGVTQPERVALLKLLAAAKGARDTLMKLPPGSVPGTRDSRVSRDVARLEDAIGGGEAMLSGAGQRGSH